MSARSVDTNGWIEIKSNPISRVGVFPYKGRTIDPEGKLGLDPTAFYNVYRPAEELSKQKTLDSFRLLPWTEDHPAGMLGNAPDLIPAEEKGIHGITGEDIHFDGEFLLANVKVLSQELADSIDSGKTELSVGYWALYKPKKGEYNGQQYQFIQTDILGNHLSSVNEGRSGREVSVLDSKHFDGETSMKEDNKAEENTKAKDAEQPESGAAANGVMERLERIEATLSKLMGIEKSEGAATDGDEKRDEGDTTRDAKAKDAEENKKEESKSKAMDAMDAAEIRKSFFREAAAKEKLAENISQHIGSFDSAEMTLEEVAKYAVKKLGLMCKPGNEQAVLTGYLAGAKVNRSVATADGLMEKPVAINSVSSQVDAYFNQDGVK